MYKIIKIIIIAFVGLSLAQSKIHEVDHPFIDLLGNFDLYFAALVFLVVLFFDIKKYRQTKRWIEFAASFTGILITLGFFICLYVLNQRDKSPVKFSCVTKQNDFNGIAIEFREDGTYKLTSWCIGANIYRGNYKLNDSIITIDKSKIEAAIVSNKLVIRTDSIDSKTGEAERSIYQIDKAGKIIGRSTDFRFIEK